MSRAVSSFELSINRRSPNQTLANWLYGELRRAILEGRLRAGVKLPASRDFAKLYHVSRGTVVNVFERLLDEGYLLSRVGVGTWVNSTVPFGKAPTRMTSEKPEYVRRVVFSYKKPKQFVGWVRFPAVRPFGMGFPALAE